MLPEDGIQAFKDLNAEVLFPIHWGAFSLAPHAWDNPPRETSRLAKENGINLMTPKMGEVALLSDWNKTTEWWAELYSEITELELFKTAQVNAE